jgi:hypothetical protein
MVLSYFILLTKSNTHPQRFFDFVMTLGNQKKKKPFGHFALDLKKNCCHNAKIHPQTKI